MENPAAEPEPEPEADAPEPAVPDLDTTRPHMARIYDYFLGGKNHFASDRETADQLLKTNPSLRTSALENRAFLARAVRYLVAQAGIRQFLDVGTGLPTANNVHEVAQAIAPESRVVYVDNDPMVLAHARAAHVRAGRPHRLHRLRPAQAGGDRVAPGDPRRAGL
jgi:hypothetical protein